MSLAARIRLAQKRGLSLPAARTLARLSTPRAIQDFLVDFPQNFEPEGDTARSVEQTLKHHRAHCIEGAMVAAFALWLLRSFARRLPGPLVVLAVSTALVWLFVVTSNCSKVDRS